MTSGFEGFCVLFAIGRMSLIYTTTGQTNMGCSIANIPNEIVHHTFGHLPPVAFGAVQLVCRRFFGLLNSMNWHEMCRKYFKYWDHRNGKGVDLLQSGSNLDWKRSFVARHRIDLEVTNLLSSVLTSQTGRLSKIERVVELGYDAKDTLLRHLAVDDATDDVLARRYVYSSNDPIIRLQS